MVYLRWLAFITGYVTLDWVSYLHALNGLNITPWNPALSLGLVCWLAYGRVVVVPWFAALILGEGVVRGWPATPLQTALNSALLLTGYVSIAELWRRFASVRTLLTNQAHLLAWLVISLVGTLVTASVYIIALSAEGLIQPTDRIAAFLQFWVGDFVGIIATMPFFWLAIIHPERLTALLHQPGTMVLTLLSIAAVAIAFSLGAAGEFQYFYLLFLPLVLSAARGGLAAAAVAAFVLQASVVVAVRALNILAVTVLELQLLAAALASLGLFVGILVDERQRAAAELQHSLRLAAAGEMAAALAHELNQPLTALSTYGVAAEELLARPAEGERLRETVRAMVAESHHAAEVVRRLRDFFTTGATRLETISLPDLLALAPSLLDRAATVGARLDVRPIPQVRVLADRVQIEVVLRNLVLNALDAVSMQQEGERLVAVEAEVSSPGWACITVTDSGAGLTRAGEAGLFEPFHTTKANGMGLGLAISRAIAEAHGGSLVAEIGPGGLFRLRLPLEKAVNAA